MQRIFAFIFSCTFLAAAYATASADYPPWYPNNQPSYALLNALNAVQSLSGGSLLAVQSWAQNSDGSPPNPVFSDSDRVEAQIAALRPGDKAAVISWLAGGGRGKLYTQGATDAQIGKCLFPIDPPSCSSGPSASPSPNYRTLPFALAPNAADAGGIAIERGFAVVSNDGTSETHCLSFKNVESKIAVAVTFEYQLSTHGGDVLFTGTNVRAGTFSPGIEIAGPASYSDFQSAMNRDLKNNCWTTSSSLANVALLRAAFMTIQVKGVRYEDGSTWSAGGQGSPQ
jgi:hypothetical protein